MPQLSYPAELTKKSWDKKKPVLAKTKKTLIGENLTALEKLHNSINWKNLDPPEAISFIDRRLAAWPEEFSRTFKPLATKAKEVQQLALKWAAEFKKEKLMPKSAAVAATEVADAAKAYQAAVLDFEGEVAKALVAARKKSVANLSKLLKPMVTKGLVKTDGLIKDIKAFGANPTQENFWKLFGGDSNARGYTTACKNWDQLLAEFPEIRDQCHKGKAMKDFFPGMADYGANYDQEDFDKKVNSKTGKTGEECYKWHARHLIQEVSNIKKLEAAMKKCESLLT